MELQRRNDEKRASKSSWNVGVRKAIGTGNINNAQVHNTEELRSGVGQRRKRFQPIVYTYNCYTNKYSIAHTKTYVKSVWRFKFFLQITFFRIKRNSPTLESFREDVWICAIKKDLLSSPFQVYSQRRGGGKVGFAKSSNVCEGYDHKLLWRQRPTSLITKRIIQHSTKIVTWVFCSFYIILSNGLSVSGQ